MPLVSVIMPVKNGEQYLQTSLDSIFRQSHENLELIVVDDNSEDGTRKILDEQTDPRLRVISNSSKGGLVAALNLGISAARGEFIARLDSDDIAVQSRIEEQLAYLSHNPNVGLCGAWMRTFGTNRRVIKYPADPARIRAKLLFESPLGHPAILARASLFHDNKLRYDEDFAVAEDFRLWSEISRVTELGNLPEVLVHYRVHPGQVSFLKNEQRVNSVRKILSDNLEASRVRFTADELEIHLAISTNSFFLGENPGMFFAMRRWFQKIRDAHNGCSASEMQALDSELKYQFRKQFFWGTLNPVRRGKKLLSRKAVR